MKRLWNSSLVVKVFLSYFVVVALLFLSFYFSSNLLLRHFYIRSLSTRMEQEAHLLARMVPFDQVGAALDSLSRQLSGELGARVTIIATDGRVLGDSAEISNTWKTTVLARKFSRRCEWAREHRFAIAPLSNTACSTALSIRPDRKSTRLN